MPEPWFWAALLVTLIASVVNLFVWSRRQPEGQASLWLYFQVPRHPFQIVRDYGWGLVYGVMFLLLFLGAIVPFSMFLPVDHSPPVLFPGCFWPIVVLPALAVVQLVRELRTATTPQAEPDAPEESATLPNQTASDAGTLQQRSGESS